MEKNNLSQRHHGTLLTLVMLLLVVFMAGNVSAIEWDNRGDYDPITRTVIIKNAFGWGATIGTAQLETPLNVKVGAGVDQQVGIFNIVTEENGNNILGALDLEDKKNGGVLARGKQYKVETFKEILVDDYKTVCEEVINGTNTTQICTQEEIGSHLETVIEWKPIKASTEFIAGVKYRIGIYVDVEVGDYGDWVPTIYGVKVPAWSTWTEDLNTGIISYYKLDGDITDELGIHNGTNYATTNTSLIINSARDFSGSSQYLEMGPAFVPAEYTINMWIKPDAFTANLRLFDDKGSSNNNGFLAYFPGSGAIRWTTYDGSAGSTLDSNTTLSTGITYMATFRQDTSGNKELFINAVGKGKATGVNSHTTGASTMKFGTGFGASGDFFNGKMDEIGIWSRALSISEITQLYNGGVGITYIIGSNSPTITLTSPTTANHTTTQNININFTATDDVNLSSVKLYVNGVLNQTDASGINNSVYSFPLTLGDGDYNIYGTATDNESQTTQTNNITIGIDTIAPVLTVNDITDSHTYALPINKALNMSVIDVHPGTCIYWTSDNSTNNTITCGTPVNVSFATGGNKTIYTWVNDTYGLTATAQDSFYINYIQESLGYSPTVLALDDQTLYLNITATDITTYDVNFTYNGTAYTPTISKSGTLLQAYVILTNPAPSTNVINWTYQINALTNSTNVTQTVKALTPLVVQSGACTNLAVTFQLQDEVNGTNLTGSIAYNIKYGPSLASNKALEVYGEILGTKINICINATESPSYYIGYGELQYSVTSYVDRRFYMFEDSTISNATYEIKFLRELETTEQTSFLLTLQDSDLNVYANKYTALWRWYPDLNSYKIVEMGKTDGDGQTVAHVRTEDVDYRTALYELNGSLIKFDSPRRFLCTSSPCSLDIVVGDEGADLTAFFDIEQSLTYNETTGIISYVFNDPNQLTQSMRLLVEKINPNNEITICDTTTTGYTGVINCNISIYSGTFKATVFRTASPEVPIASKLINTADTLFRSSFGLFFSAILWLAIVLTGLAGGPILTIVLAIVALLPALFLGSINLAIFTGFAVLGAIILHFIKRASD